MDEPHHIDQSIEQALDMLEHPETLSEEELQRLLADEECLRACRDLMAGSRALMATLPPYQADVEREWNKLRARHKAWRRRLWLHWSMATGVAAMVALLAFFSWSHFRSDRDAAPVTVFVADNRPQQVTLQTGDGKLIALSETPDASIPVPGARLEKKELDYNTAGTSSPQIKMHTLTTPRGADFKVVLSDGSEVWLNAESRLEYPASFTGPERVVYLRGEAYFKIAKDTDHPFIVRTDDMQTRVLGTEFNVRNYSLTDSHVTLIHGSVEVCNNKGGDYVRVVPGEDACLCPDGAFSLKEVDVDGYIYWKEGFFYFDNVTLLDIMQSLGRWYNVTILFKDKAAMNYRMHFLSDRRAGLPHAIELLNRMKKVKVSLSEGTIVVD